jgi:hypothetical protein
LKKIPVDPHSLAEYEKIRFGDYRRNLKSFNCKFDGNPVAVGSQTADHARSEIGQVGMVPKAFSAINVRNMYLDKRDCHARQCITQRHAGMRQSAGIDDDGLNPFFLRCMDAINQLAFVIALESVQSRTCDLGLSAR